MHTLANKTDKDTIVKRIKDLKPETQPLWGRMTANQMICHLADQMRHGLGERENPQLGNFFFHTVGKWLFLYVLPIPRNVKTSPKADQMTGGTKPTDFESDRNTLIEYVERMFSAPDDLTWASHFRFGKMDKREWCALSHKHFDHHLRQFRA